MGGTGAGAGGEGDGDSDSDPGIDSTGTALVEKRKRVGEEAEDAVLGRRRWA